MSIPQLFGLTRSANLFPRSSNSLWIKHLLQSEKFGSFFFVIRCEIKKRWDALGWKAEMPDERLKPKNRFKTTVQRCWEENTGNSIAPGSAPPYGLSMPIFLLEGMSHWCFIETSTHWVLGHLHTWVGWLKQLHPGGTKDAADVITKIQLVSMMKRALAELIKGTWCKSPWMLNILLV